MAENRTSKRDYLVWIDMEMTGLDPDKDRVIEIATIITDGQLRVIEEGPQFIVHQPKRVMQAMDEWNRKHHGSSGLTEAVLASKLTVRAAERQTLAFIKKYCPSKTAPLCGNSVHHDRRFLARHMPKLHEYLHYRLVDVSSIKELVKRWYGPARFPAKKECHRALDDIRESIEELKFYRRKYFKAPRIHP